MTKGDLKEKLDLLGINPFNYSLDGELKFDAIVLYGSYNNWEVFYFDERGKKDQEKKFWSESDACDYMYKLFRDAKEIQEKFGVKNLK